MTVTAAASAACALIGHVYNGDLTVLNALIGGDTSTLMHGLQGVPWWPMLYTGVFTTALCLWIEVRTSVQCAAALLEPGFNVTRLKMLSNLHETLENQGYLLHFRRGFQLPKAFLSAWKKANSQRLSAQLNLWRSRTILM